MAALNFISLFSGAGGLDLGLEEAGWNCRYASDVDFDAVKCMERNRLLRVSGRRGSIFKRTFIEQADVRELKSSSVLGKACLEKGGVDLLAGGPPCQSWSSAGHQLGLKDPRGQLFKEFVRIASEVDTRWLLFENVRGLLTARGPDGIPGSALELVREQLLLAGFQTSVHLLNSADFGIPQRRVRLFIIGYRDGDEPKFPTASHSKQADEESDLLPWVPLKSCLSEVPDIAENEIIRPTGKMAKELRDVRPGSGVKSPGKKESTRPGGHWGYKQGAFIADVQLPARTVTASGQQDWIIDPTHGLRRLSPRECAAIQTFPKHWNWSGKNSVDYRLIGNAVPPLLSEKIGASLALSAKTKRKKQRRYRPSAIRSLPGELEAAISYTKREEKTNGKSRRAAPNRKRVKTKNEVPTDEVSI